MSLAAYVDKIGSIPLGTDRGVRPASRQRLASTKTRADLEQASRRVHDGIANQRRFQGARLREHERATVAVRFQGHRQRAANWPEIPGQSELACKFVGF